MDKIPLTFSPTKNLGFLSLITLTISLYKKFRSSLGSLFVFATEKP